MNADILQRLIHSTHTPLIDDTRTSLVRDHTRALVARLLYIRKKIAERRAQSSSVVLDLAEAEAFAWVLRIITHPAAQVIAQEQVSVPDEPSCPSCGQSL